MALLQDWYRHSPWSGNMYREAPDAFLWRFAFAKRDEMSAKASVGTSVEFAIAQVLLGIAKAEDATAIATAEFDKAVQGEVINERADIPAIVEQALAGFRGLNQKLLTYQSVLRVDAGMKYGLRFPIKAKTDFGYEDLTVDCKVTWRMPSSPKFSHVCQLGTYHALTGKSQALLYVTPKKNALIRLNEEDLAAGFACMLSTWRRIEALADRCDTPESAADLIAHNPDSYFWSPASRKEAATVWL